MLRLYALWIPSFEVRVLTWQSLLKQGNGEGSGEEFQSYIIGGMWNNEDGTLLYNTKKEVSARPILARTEFRRRI